MEINAYADLHNLQFSPNVIRVIKSKRTRPAGQEARIGETIMHKIFW